MLNRLSGRRFKSAVPSNADDSPSPYGALLVVHLDRVDSHARKPKAPTEWPVVSHEVGTESFEVLVLLQGDSRHGGMMSPKSDVPSFDLGYDDGVAVDGDDVGFKAARVPVALNGGKAAA